ncbi:MAG: uracil-DNA glycosylase [Thaumarchaeota archaeon]|nr:uracil-DNA glycosylase [Nitrososphaerota archaeon]
MNTWDDMQFWSSKEWEIVQERLDKDIFNPARESIFAAFDATPLDKVKVAILGQDPYPDPRLATGLAFSIPEDIQGFPPTLDTIFKEYCNDLHLPYPSSGDLRPWCSRGVFLYNVIPTCDSYRSLSNDWPEWSVLSREVVETLCKEGVVIVLLGRKARELRDIVNYYEVLTPKENILIELCHPSTRAIANAKTEAKFLGSRLFSRANEALVTLGRGTIDWRL